MRIVIKACKENELQYGETIKIKMASGKNYSFAAEDIDAFVSALLKAKDVALVSEIGAEPTAFVLDL